MGKLGEARWVFLRTLATLVSAGIPIMRSLEICGEQFTEPKFKEMARTISTNLGSGRRLSECFRLHPWFFTSFHCHLLAVAEKTGALALVLMKLAEYEEKSIGLRRELAGKLTYPAILFLVSIAGLVLLPMFALEGLFKVLESSGADLPVLTIAFIQASRFLRSPLGILLVALCLFVGTLTVRQIRSSHKQRQRFMNLCLNTPVLGEVLRVSQVARFSMSLGLQLEVGVSPLEALRIAAETSNSASISSQMKNAIEALKGGDTLSQSLERVDHLDLTFTSMLSVGEESGKVPQLLKKLSIFYQEEVERTLETLTSLLEPIMLCVMGVLFAIMLLATMLPLVHLVQAL